MNRIYTVKPEEYPLLLGESIYKPKQLYAMGTLPPPTSVGIAMVGTRRPGNSAQELCRRLVGALRGTDAVIVSGLAQGIDSLCHEAALEAGIPTVAVLAQGLGTKIEGSRGELARRILERGGAIVSEFEPDTPAYKGNFPARNRIISGLSRATVIVQSKAKGGALITAEFARKEGKPLYAIPGDFDSEVAGGTNDLLDRELARPVFRPESLASILGLPRRGGQSIAAVESSGCRLGGDARALFAKVNGYRKTFPELQAPNNCLFATNSLRSQSLTQEKRKKLHTK